MTEEEFRTGKPKPQKKATITLVMDEDVNNNDFKDWLKSCPFSPAGGQTVLWESVIPDIAEQSAPADTAVGETKDEAAG